MFICKHHVLPIYDDGSEQMTSRGANMSTTTSSMLAC